MKLFKRVYVIKFYCKIDPSVVGISTIKGRLDAHEAFRKFDEENKGDYIATDIKRVR